jgi:hypothetical protein
VVDVGAQCQRADAGTGGEVAVGIDLERTAAGRQLQVAAEVERRMAALRLDGLPARAEADVAQRM